MALRQNKGLHRDFSYIVDCWNGGEMRYDDPDLNRKPKVGKFMRALIGDGGGGVYFWLKNLP